MSGGFPAFSRTLSCASNSEEPSNLRLAPVHSSNGTKAASYISSSGLRMEA